MITIKRFARLIQSRADVSNTDHASEIQSSLHEVILKLDELTQAQLFLRDTAFLQLKRARPSRRAWALAGISLVLTAGLVTASALWMTRASSLSSQATTFEVQAEAAGLRAGLALAPLENITVRTGSYAVAAHLNGAMKDQLKGAIESLKIAVADRAKASRMEGGATKYQIGAQVGLAFGSVLLGAIVSWIVIEMLADIRRGRDFEKGILESQGLD